jgi:hypothetical protein
MRPVPFYIPRKEAGMSPRRRWTCSLFFTGITLLLLSSWMLHNCLPPRLQVPVAARNAVRKVVRVIPVPQRRSSWDHEAIGVASNLHDCTCRIAAS